MATINTSHKAPGFHGSQKRKILDDKDECIAAIDFRDKRPATVVRDKMIAVYKNQISGIEKHSNNADVYSDLKVISELLEQFCRFGNASSLKGASRQLSINIKTNNNVTINNITTISIIQDINNDQTISPEERAEAIEKVYSLDSISNENIPQKDKWSKLKPILQWITNQSVDLATKIIPLILKTISNDTTP